MDSDGEKNNENEVINPDNHDSANFEDLELESRNNFLSSVLTGDAEKLRKCFADADDPNHEKANEWLMIRDDIGRNALFTAAILGHCEVIQELVTQGASVNEKTNRGYTPLHCAAAWGKLESLKTLVGLGANVQTNNFRDEKARDVAKRYSMVDCIEFLDWAESKMILELYIHNIQETVSDLEKSQGKLSKQDRNASIEEFEEQKKQLEMTVDPIITKLTMVHASHGRKDFSPLNLLTYTEGGLNFLVLEKSRFHLPHVHWTLELYLTQGNCTFIHANQAAFLI
ncbi:ankyrin repeat domain-containing protein 45 isoform X2 [Narcine bancroftii]|uniref:ankyrin repeat domain-containing protein 45 isoform X2 n=1 Tax=Narcine bancroftii TaxID=1343680 RepID=UPI00383165F2